ncbi:hypothetical protein SKAU_G00073790 [Synaphobranchus kaupii]|uniref:Uncharacterized protein n=1 Tax=Synaphobranchus kaupii TaxID=118154 RepID=A0A9Q1J9S5_SYNKA|nr:hypothetical protein SKAU_G00073790 [Synaphobranchus kaupii]
MLTHRFLLLTDAIVTDGTKQGEFFKGACPFLYLKEITITRAKSLSAGGNGRQKQRGRKICWGCHSTEGVLRWIYTLCSPRFLPP